jgi:hypothetical protein
MSLRPRLLLLAVIAAAACDAEPGTPDDSIAAYGEGDGKTDSAGAAWRKVRDCGEREAVVDHNEGACSSTHCPNGGTVLDYQLVIRNPDAIDFLNDVGVWQSGFGDDEIIVQGWRWPGSDADHIRFRQIIDCAAPGNDCRWIDVFDDFGGVKVAFTHRTTRCTNLDPAQGCLGTWKTEEVEDANWWFAACKR